MARSSHAKFATHISYVGGLFIGPVPEKSVWTRILKNLISEEECKLGMHLTRTPTSAEDVAKKVGRPVKEVSDMLWNMALADILLYRVRFRKTLVLFVIHTRGIF